MTERNLVQTSSQRSGSNGWKGQSVSWVLPRVLLNNLLTNARSVQLAEDTFDELKCIPYRSGGGGAALLCVDFPWLILGTSVVICSHCDAETLGGHFGGSAQ